jgi:hypothetical protein
MAYVDAVASRACRVESEFYPSDAKTVGRHALFKEAQLAEQRTAGHACALFETRSIR